MTDHESGEVEEHDTTPPLGRPYPPEYLERIQHLIDVLPRNVTGFARLLDDDYWLLEPLDRQLDDIDMDG